MITYMGAGRTRNTLVIRAALVLLSLLLTAVAANSVAASDKRFHIVAFGDSLTAGYRLPQSDAFPVQLQSALSKRGHPVRITNAGVSGDTTSGGLARFDWAVPSDTDAVILELGANDALRGVSPKIARDNLDAILTRLATRNIPVLITGMRAPANWGPDYVAEFDRIFSDLAKKHGRSCCIRSSWRGSSLRPELKLDDALASQQGRRRGNRQTHPARCRTAHRQEQNGQGWQLTSPKSQINGISVPTRLDGTHRLFL